MNVDKRGAIQKQLIAIIADVLLTPLQELPEDAQLIEDLGIESIDLLDILYKLEDTFAIEVGEPLPVFDGDFYAPVSGNFDGGALTEKGIVALKRYPFLDEKRLAASDAKTYLRSLGLLIDLIAYHLESSPG